MEVTEIIEECIEKGGIGLLVLLTLIQISPIKINPWSKIASWIGNALNKNLTDQVEDLKNEVTSVKEDIKTMDDKMKENDAINARVRILRFGDEISHGVNHSRDHYQQIMTDITMYNQYCEDNPKFKNNMTKITSARIEEEYMERDRNNSFL